MAPKWRQMTSSCACIHYARTFGVCAQWGQTTKNGRWGEGGQFGGRGGVRPRHRPHTMYPPGFDPIGITNSGYSNTGRCGIAPPSAVNNGPETRGLPRERRSSRRAVMCMPRRGAATNPRWRRGCTCVCAAESGKHEGRLLHARHTTARHACEHTPTSRCCFFYDLSRSEHQQQQPSAGAAQLASDPGSEHARMHPGLRSTP